MLAYLGEHVGAPGYWRRSDDVADLASTPRPGFVIAIGHGRVRRRGRPDRRAHGARLRRRDAATAPPTAPATSSDNIFSGYGAIVDLVHLSLSLPLVLGVFLGAMLVARETEQSTNVLVWTQTGDPATLVAGQGRDSLIDRDACRERDRHRARHLVVGHAERGLRQPLRGRPVRHPEPRAGRVRIVRRCARARRRRAVPPCAPGHRRCRRHLHRRPCARLSVPPAPLHDRSDAPLRALREVARPVGIVDDARDVGGPKRPRDQRPHRSAGRL